MQSLAACSQCQGFIADLSRACPHCEAAPSRWRRLARILSAAVVGAFSMTLMACYGAGPDGPYPCNYGDPQCECEYYGNCDQGCSYDSECEVGEYCNQDTWPTMCLWSGTCSDDLQCPGDMVCDIYRGTCHPGDRPGCDGNWECLTPAERCDLDTRTCVPTTSCEVACGDGEVCDRPYDVCVPCEGDACGTCVGESLCGLPPPTCAEGTVPGVLDDCYTGGCIADATCEAQACAALDEDACNASDACNPVYGGINCSNPEGDPCSGGASCTCESFVFLDCVVAPPPPPGP